MPFDDARVLALLEKTRRIGKWCVDVRSGATEWSKLIYAIHEEEPNKPILLENWIDYYVSEHRPAIRKCVERAVREGTSWDVELKLLTARDNVLWVRVIGEPLFEDGVVCRLQGVLEDVSARRQLEVEREEMLMLQLEGEHLARLGHWKTLTTNQLEWTAGAKRIFGFDEAAAPPSVEQFRERVHPEDRESFGRDTAAARASLEPATLSFRIVVNGQTRYLRVRSVPRLDDTGKLQELVGIVTDDTDSVAAVQRHDELRQRLSFALEAAEIGAFDWDLITNELAWDRQMYHIYGTLESQFDGAYAAWERGLHPEDKEAAVAAIQLAVRGNTKFDTQFRILWPSGEVRVIRALAKTQLDSAGQPVRMIGVNWDITESEKNRRELERSNRELAQLAYRASHDLKAPLTTIRRLAQYIAEDIPEGRLTDAARNLDVIIRQAASLENLVLGILESARGDITGAKLQDVDLDSLVKEVTESLGALSAVKGVVVTQQVSTPRNYLLPKVRLYQILTNLISNAIRYSDPAREQRQVRIAVSEQANCIRLVVADNGLGIPPEAKKSIYEMFRTFHSSEVSGSGLGMYIVGKHVEALEGAIAFDSSPEGTTFQVELPMRDLT